MIDDLVKDHLHGQLKSTRQTLVWKLDGLSEYGVRRPLTTTTGTNLLGLVKHLAAVETWYLGEVFGRPFPQPLGRWQDADGSDLRVSPTETRDQIIDFYHRARGHAGTTVERVAQQAAGDSPHAELSDTGRAVGPAL